MAPSSDHQQPNGTSALVNDNPKLAFHTIPQAIEAFGTSA